MPDAVEEVRRHVEGTGLSLAAVAAKVGMAQATVWRLAQKHGWRRPADIEQWKPLVAIERAGFGAPLAAAFGRVAALAGRERARLEGERSRIAAAIAAAVRAEAAAKRQAELHGEDRSTAPRLRIVSDGGGTGLVRLSTGPSNARRGRARPAGDVRTARGLIEGTTLSQVEIARRIGVSRVTLSRWVGDGGWIRPIGAPSPLGRGQRRTRRGRARAEAHREATRRLEAAVATLAELEAADTAGTDRIAAAFAALDGVREALRVKLAPPDEPLPDMHLRRGR